MNRLTHTEADCAECWEILEDKDVENVFERKSLVLNCKNCSGTLRDPIPWTELFTEGWRYETQ